MNKILLLIVFALSVPCSIYSQSSWEKAIIDSTINFSTVMFLNSQTGYVRGRHFIGSNNSRLYKTTNSGNNWFSVITEPARDDGMWFIDVNTGFISSYYPGYPVGGGNISKTTNGGISWQNIRSVVGSITYVYFLNGLTGWHPNYQAFSKTTDGGLSWFNITTPSTYTSEVQFLDINNGYYLSGNVFRTTNGGLNWSQKGSINYIASDMLFLDTLNGFIVGKQTYGAILKTTNGGLNWDLVFTALEGITRINFPTFNVGYAIGDSNRIFRTSNAGYNWQIQNLDSSYRYKGLSFASAYTGFVVGQRGIILRTTNGGSTFINQGEGDISLNYSLSQNYPNPFNPTTNIKFDITKLSNVKIVVYDVSGREVQTLVNERLQPGTYETTFDGSAFNSGVYFYRMVTEGYSETKKMLLIK